MIVRPGPSLAPDEAAARAARGRDPVWQSSPGRDADDGIAWDVVAADPVEVVMGDDTLALEEAWARARARWNTSEPTLPVGFGALSYELGVKWMGLARPPDDAWPAVSFRFYEAVWRRTADEHAEDGRSEIVAVDEAAARRLEGRLLAPWAEGAGRSPASTSLQSSRPASPPVVLSAWRSRVTREAYETQVRELLGHIAAGDIYQANYARCLEAQLLVGDSLDLAVALRQGAPAPHAFWFSSREEGQPETWALVGNSPERFVYLDGAGLLETRPIKGTRRREADPARDALARHELEGAAKDLAEHVMIVDLERNDLGRVCLPGSVVVEGMARVVSLPTVHHLVSTVKGQLLPDVSLTAVLKALFPGGSITGAPKHRAMSLIQQAELRPRGAYTGATGWLGAAGDADLAIAIRTATVLDREVSLGVGGGIVADSQPADEWDETVAKAEAFARVGRSR